MSISSLRRPSAGLVVSIVALTVALGGTSYAALSLPTNSVGTKQLRSAAVTTNKLKNGSVTKAKLNLAGLVVPQAVHASGADTATNATHAVTAQSAAYAANAGHANTADSASSIAYAHVLSNGTIDVAHSKNVTSVSMFSAGVYCLKTSVPVRNASATVDLANSAGQFGIAIAVIKGEDPAGFVSSYCPGGENVIVGTTPPDGPPVANRAFFVTFN
jgi:hypothetical protein